MNPDRIVEETKKKLQTAVEHFGGELKKVRTGRASAGMLDGVMVDAYGQPMPLNQTATISVPEPQLLQITPFDPNNLQAITAAIRDNQSLGLNPMDDGRVVRVPIPPLTEERRREIAKQLNEKMENCMINLRQIRHEALRHTEQAKKNKEIGENDQQRIDRQVDELMGQHKAEAEKMTKAKEQEILTL
ncbi:MAG TPA: ribosome recycling factor [Candidatus Saccharimonadales bacterium]|nr:ribosome recycling factor [Candidatus Saccharimonadales bacterium]